MRIEDPDINPWNNNHLTFLQKYTMEKRQPLQQMVQGKLNVHMGKNETRSLSLSLYKNQLHGSLNLILYTNQFHGSLYITLYKNQLHESLNLILYKNQLHTFLCLTQEKNELRGNQNLHHMRPEILKL